MSVSSTLIFNPRPLTLFFGLCMLELVLELVSLGLLFALAHLNWRRIVCCSYALLLQQNATLLCSKVMLFLLRRPLTFVGCLFLALGLACASDRRTVFGSLFGASRISRLGHCCTKYSSTFLYTIQNTIAPH